jgi:cytoskeletal protein CcmA (bactofilin family)
VSCPDGATLAAYAAGELLALERRNAEAHLVRCRECRGRVVALREAESRASAGTGDASRPEPAAPSGRGFALGFPLALGAVALVLAALGELAGGGGSGGSWLSALRLSGVYGMAFDFVFWVRDRAPGLLELLAALAATASVAGIAALAVASLARRLGPPLAVALAFAGASAAPADAFEVRTGETVEVAAGETLAGSLAASGEDVRVLGRVGGDLFVAGERVVIGGSVAGNVFAWARELDVSGEIGGSLHAASEQLRLGGRIGGGSYTLAEDFTAGEGARVAGDALGMGWSAVYAGTVERDLHWSGETLVVRGRVGGDLHVPRAARVRLEDGAGVGRDLRVGVERESDLTIAPGAHIGGSRRIEPAVHGDFWEPRPWLWGLVRVAAALAFGVALYALLPGLFRARVPTLGSFVRLLGVGLLALVCVPLALLLVGLTLVGLPLALLGAFAYATALYLGYVLAAAELGRALLRRGSETLPSLGSFARILLVGLVAAAAAAYLPGLGGAVWVVMLLVGLGLVADRARALVGRGRPA